MEVEVLGTRGNVEASAPYHSRHSGVLVEGKVLLDLGEREFLDRDPLAIFITHLHPDHAFFVKERVEIEVPVYAPEESSMLDLVVIQDRVTVNGIRVTPVTSEHSALVRSTAYLVEQEGKRLLYTGDMVWIRREELDKIGRMDMVITDGSFIRKGGMVRRSKETGEVYGHNGIPDLVRLFSPYTDRIVFAHFGSWFFRGAREARQRLESMGDGARVEASYDGWKAVL